MFFFSWYIFLQLFLLSLQFLLHAVFLHFSVIFFPSFPSFSSSIVFSFSSFILFLLSCTRVTFTINLSNPYFHSRVVRWRLDWRIGCDKIENEVKDRTGVKSSREFLIQDGHRRHPVKKGLKGKVVYATEGERKWKYNTSRYLLLLLLLFPALKHVSFYLGICLPSMHPYLSIFFHPNLFTLTSLLILF